ncbi:MAG: hypothetical protein ABH869_03695 [Candidatus Omnitrophota bacterium]
MKKIFPAGTILMTLVLTLMFVPACVPSYPKEKLPEAVTAICKAEYDMDVDVTVTGRTMGLYYPIAGLLDTSMRISKDAWDTISNLLLIASRVVLSTDADIDFYCVITQDARVPEIQVVIIKYVDDIKQSMYQNISRNETFKRTLFSLNLTPQARKERSIEQIFDKMKVPAVTRQSVLDDFFRSPPTKLSDIGYWRKRFYLKDICMEEFIPAQIANRLRLDFKGEGELSKMFDYETSEGIFVEDEGIRNLWIKFKIADQIASQGEAVLKEKKIEEVLKIANEVVSGYKYKKFDYLILEDQLENVQLKIQGCDVYDFVKEKMEVKSIVQAPAEYF